MLQHIKGCMCLLGVVASHDYRNDPSVPLTWCTSLSRTRMAYYCIASPTWIQQFLSLSCCRYLYEPSGARCCCSIRVVSTYECDRAHICHLVGYFYADLITMILPVVKFHSYQAREPCGPCILLVRHEGCSAARQCNMRLHLVGHGPKRNLCRASCMMQLFLYAKICTAPSYSGMLARRSLQGTLGSLW